MQHLEGSGTPVLYIGRTVLKVNPSAMHNSVLGTWYSVVQYIKGPTVANMFFFSCIN